MTHLTGRLFATAALAVLPAQALADVTAQGVFDAFSNIIEVQGATAVATGMDMSGSNVTLTGVTITGRTSSGETETLPLGRIEFRNVTETDNGSYVVEEAAMEGFRFNDDGLSISIQGVALGGLYLPSDAETNPILKGPYYAAAKTGPMTVSVDGNEVISAESMEVTTSPYAPDTTLESKGQVSGISFDPSTVDDEQFKQTVAALGYETITGSMSFDSAWNVPEGRLLINELTFTGDDAADLTVKADIGGYTLAIADALQKMQANSANATDEQAGLAMLGLLQQLEIGSLSIAVKDQSLTGRVLDFVAAQQGMNRESVVAMAKGMVPFGLGQLGAPDFAAKTTAAVGQYLDNPDTITISANPPAPVPVAALMAGASQGPASIIQSLNVKVTANE